MSSAFCGLEISLSLKKVNEIIFWDKRYGDAYKMKSSMLSQRVQFF